MLLGLVHMLSRFNEAMELGFKRFCVSHATSFMVDVSHHACYEDRDCHESGLIRSVLATGKLGGDDICSQIQNVV